MGPLDASAPPTAAAPERRTGPLVASAPPAAPAAPAQHGRAHFCVLDARCGGGGATGSEILVTPAPPTAAAPAPPGTGNSCRAVAARYGGPARPGRKTLTRRRRQLRRRRHCRNGPPFCAGFGAVAAQCGGVGAAGTETFAAPAPSTTAAPARPVRETLAPPAPLTAAVQCGRDRNLCRAGAAQCGGADAAVTETLAAPARPTAAAPVRLGRVTLTRRRRQLWWRRRGWNGLTKPDQVVNFGYTNVIWKRFTLLTDRIRIKNRKYLISGFFWHIHHVSLLLRDTLRITERVT